MSARQSLWLATLCAALSLSPAVHAADASTALNTLGQIAGAVYGANASAHSAPVDTSLPVPIYTKDQMVAMNCLDLELATSKLDRAIARSKSTATDLYEQEKAANAAPTSQQQQQMRSIASILGAVAQSRGGKAAEYAGIASQIGGLNTSTVSQALDVELDRLQKMNEQAADLAIIRRHKNCLAATNPSTSTATTAAATGAAALAAGAVATKTQTSSVAGTQTLTSTETLKPAAASATKTKKAKKAKKSKKARKK